MFLRNGMRYRRNSNCYPHIFDHVRIMWWNCRPCLTLSDVNRHRFSRWRTSNRKYIVPLKWNEISPELQRVPHIFDHARTIGDIADHRNSKWRSTNRKRLPSHFRPCPNQWWHCRHCQTLSDVNWPRIEIRGRLTSKDQRWRTFNRKYVVSLEWNRISPKFQRFSRHFRPCPPNHWCNRTEQNNNRTKSAWDCLKSHKFS